MNLQKPASGYFVAIEGRDFRILKTEGAKATADSFGTSDEYWWEATESLDKDNNFHASELPRVTREACVAEAIAFLSE